MLFQKSLLTATLLAAAVSANAAGTANGSFKVNLKIDSVCSAEVTNDANGVNFGTVLAGTSEATVGIKSSATAVVVKCSKNAPYIVNLTPLSNAGANTTGAGTMAGPGTDTINYQLYSNAGATTVWGNTGTLAVVGNGVSGTGTGLLAIPNTHTVYSKLTSTTDIQLGNYSDTVKVSVTY
ncbi:spore coat U domain-containing protein [Psychrobacter sp. DAB_AL43B]|uniref:Csu type fimbrial protein n=1 Tax=Psychrobacter sp. DAB_AL43B TaxID=1028416 RepID=UPI0009A67A33|nr:spore coat protein U domain-containing protein [Psychrobacter sp. DAB_AL43B]SLJ85845.1 hypothetical protein DABAL43B_2668 [Psychrobacter sp. DAB_AL43B]